MTTKIFLGVLIGVFMNRFIVLLVGCSLFLNQGFAQSWHDLNDKALELYNSGDCASAAVLAENTVVLIKGDVAVSNENYLTVLYNLATFYKCLGRFEDAGELFKKRAENSQRTYGRANVKYGFCLRELASFYRETGSTLRADSVNRQAAEIILKNIPTAPNRVNERGERDGKWVLLLDENWSPMEDSTLAEYYKIIIYRNGRPIGRIVDYDIFGTKRWEGTLLSETPFVPHGTVNIYYPDGTLKSTATYDEGVPEAVWTDYYADGTPRYLRRYSKGRLFGQAIRWDEEGSNYLDPDTSFDGENDIEFLLAQFDSAITKGEYEVALTLADKMYFATEDSDTMFAKAAQSVLSIGLLYATMNWYTDAESLFIEALKRWKEWVEEWGVSEPYLEQLEFMAEFYSRQNRYPEAITSLRECLSLLESTPRADDQAEHDQRVFRLSRELVSFYLQSSLFDDAYEMQRKILLLTENKYGMYSYVYCLLLNKVGGEFFFFGECGRAIEFLEQALGLVHRAVGDADTLYATVASNLGLALSCQRNYKEAEELFLSAKEIYLKQLGPRHPYYAVALNNLGTVYHAMERNEDALEVLERAWKISEELFATNKELWNRMGAGKTGVNLGAIYLRFNRGNDMAAVLSTIVNHMAELADTADTTSRNFIEGMSSCAALFSTATSADKDTLLQTVIGVGLRAKDLIGTRLGRRSKQYGELLGMLGMMYFGQESYAKADSCLTEATEIVEERFGKDHPACGAFLGMRAQSKAMVGAYAEAATLVLPAIKIERDEISRLFPLVSEKSRMQLSEKASLSFDLLKYLALKCQKDRPLLLCDMYDSHLFSKALLLRTAREDRERISRSSDTVMVRLYKTWISTLEYLNVQYGQDIKELVRRGIDLDSLRRKAENIEIELSRRSEFLGRERTEALATWKDIQTALHEGEAAIEIIRVRDERVQARDSIYYAALIVTKDTKDHPILVLLNNGNELETKYLEDFNYHIYVQEERQTPDELYDQYWKRIQENLKGISRVFLSVEGVYNQINLGTLYDPETGKYLIEEMEIRLLTNSRDLVIQPRERITPSSKTAQLFGYPNYDLGLAQQEILASHYEPERDVPIYGRTRDSLRSMGAAPLVSMKEEVEGVGSALELAGWKTVEHLGDDALEEAVKAVKSPRVLMISTHGFFLKDLEPFRNGGMVLGMQEQKVIDIPLLRSGLLLAGANRTLEGKASAEHSKKIDDGILTAYEAMNLDLDNTELVILSACETGTGVIKNGEGVYGLQRAFQVAGARSIIMSLWKVNSEATRDLMTSFFHNWLGGMEKHEAFRQAQLQLKKNHPEPYYWGAFVIVGE